jgi:hypothetical protein
VGCERLSAERVVRATCEGRQAVTGVDLKELESASRQCHRSVFKDKTELAGIEIPNATIECRAFTRDGGGINISIWINDR